MTFEVTHRPSDPGTPIPVTPRHNRVNLATLAATSVIAMGTIMILGACLTPGINTMVLPLLPILIPFTLVAAKLVHNMIEHKLSGQPPQATVSLEELRALLYLPATEETPNPTLPFTLSRGAAEKTKKPSEKPDKQTPAHRNLTPDSKAVEKKAKLPHTAAHEEGRTRGSKKKTSSAAREAKPLGKKGASHRTAQRGVFHLKPGKDKMTTLHPTPLTPKLSPMTPYTEANALPVAPLSFKAVVYTLPIEPTRKADLSPKTESKTQARAENISRMSSSQWNQNPQQNPTSPRTPMRDPQPKLIQIEQELQECQEAVDQFLDESYEEELLTPLIQLLLHIIDLQQQKSMLLETHLGDLYEGEKLPDLLRLRSNERLIKLQELEAALTKSNEACDALLTAMPQEAATPLAILLLRTIALQQQKIALLETEIDALNKKEKA